MTLLFLFALPFFFIFLSWIEIDVENWQYLLASELPRLIGNTIFLTMGVSVGVIVLGVLTAWVISMFDFKGRRLFEWMLILPLAMPVYVLAFCYIGLFDYSSGVSTFLRHHISDSFSLPEIRSAKGVVFTFSLAFYPYVYLLARGAFARQGRSLIDAARMLGVSPLGAFFKVGLPLARPAIVVGVTLALMETLADFGAVSVFNFDTFTTAIYKVWHGFFDLKTAAQLATLLLFIILLLLIVENLLRGKSKFHQPVVEGERERYLLTPMQNVAVIFGLTVIISFAFFIPLIQLFSWAIYNVVSGLDRYFQDQLWQLMLNSGFLSALAALLIILIAIMFVEIKQHARIWLRAVIKMVSSGYALPGSILAVGIVLSLATLQNQLLTPLQQWLGFEFAPLLLGTIIGLLFAYIIRFLAIGYNAVEASVQSVKPILIDVAVTLGASPWRVWRTVYLPQLLPGVLIAFLLVFIEVMKEMPATLLLRPFGWDTLTVKIYGMMTEGLWRDAALPALVLVMMGLVGVAFLVRQMKLR